MSPITSENGPPNGGLVAWSQVVAGFFTLLCTLGLSNCYGIFQAHFEQNLLKTYSSSNIAWIGTTQGFLLSLVGIVSGPLYDKGYVRSLSYVGAALNVAGLLCASFAKKYQWIFISYGIVNGLGSGISYVPALAIIQTYFSTRAPLATGITMAGSSIGGIIYPLIFRRLLDRIGFSWTCRFLALLNGIFLLTSCLLIKPRAIEGQPKTQYFEWRALRSWKLLALGFCALVLNMGVDVPFYFVLAFVQKKLNLPPEVGDSLLAGMNGSSFVGRLFLNWLAELFQPMNVWQLSILGSCVLLFCWWKVATLAGIIIFVIFYGFLVGGLMSLIPPSVREICPEPDVLGIRLGLIEGFQGVGFLIGPPIAGAIMESSAGYLGVSLFCGVLYFVLFLAVGGFTWRGFMLRKSGTGESSHSIRELQDIEPDAIVIDESRMEAILGGVDDHGLVDEVDSNPETERSRQTRRREPSKARQMEVNKARQKRVKRVRLQRRVGKVRRKEVNKVRRRGVDSARRREVKKAVRVHGLTPRT